MSDIDLAPLSLGELAELAASLRAEKQALDAQAKEVSRILERVKTTIYARLLEDGLDRASAGGYTVSISDTLCPQVEDWDAVNAFAQEHNLPDLRQRRISAALWREMLDNEMVVPGISTFVKQDVNIRKTA